MQATSQICVIGLATMGQNLALNIARNGFPITVYNRSFGKTEATLQRSEPGYKLIGAKTPEEACASLVRPRKILLLVKAGQPVDATIETFLPHLQSGDLIIDAGNSHPDDTERRSVDLAAKGFRFVGMGVSGGEEGALNGPSLMPGGERSAYDELSPILKKIAAQVEDGPCVTHVGKGAAGHFVKMVHNGIEYGDMQLIAECYDLMHNVLGMSYPAMADAFAEWNGDFLESFLIEITERILRARDPETDQPMVEVILDKAGQKGTGRWTSEIALRYGTPVPTMQAAVEARYLSAMKAQRERASQSLAGPPARKVDAARAKDLVIAVRDALYCSKICSYAQGLDLLATANADKEWGLDLGEIARIWKGGCIIRARFLASIQEAFGKSNALPNLLLDDKLGGLHPRAPGRVAVGRGPRRRARRAHARDGRESQLLRLVPARLAAAEPHPGTARPVRRAHLRADRQARRRALPPRVAVARRARGPAGPAGGRSLLLLGRRRFLRWRQRNDRLLDPLLDFLQGDASRREFGQSLLQRIELGAERGSALRGERLGRRDVGLELTGALPRGGDPSLPLGERALELPQRPQLDLDLASSLLGRFEVRLDRPQPIQPRQQIGAHGAKHRARAHRFGFGGRHAGERLVAGGAPDAELAIELLPLGADRPDLARAP